MGIILLGVGVTGVMFYAIFNELFSSNSPQAIYTIALEKCIKVKRMILKLKDLNHSIKIIIKFLGLSCSRFLR